MTAARLPSDDEVLQSFGLIDSRRGAGTGRSLLLILRDRLAGELLGDADRVGATLADEFELVTLANGARTVTARDQLVGSIRAQSELVGGALMWMDLEDLVVDTSAIAGRGRLRTLLTAAGAAARGHDDIGQGNLCVTSLPLAFFLRFDRGLMASEVIYVDPASTEVAVVPGGAMPSVNRLRTLVDEA